MASDTQHRKETTPMNQPLLISSLVSTFLLTSFVFGDDQPGNQKSARLDTQVKVQMDYLLYLPCPFGKPA
jgi:hypothetical protein